MYSPQGELMVSFENVPDELDILFRVLDSSGTEVRGWQHSPATGAPYAAWADIKSPGTYVVEVRDHYSNARSAAPYALTITQTETEDPAEPNDNVASAPPLDQAVPLYSSVTAELAATKPPNDSPAV